MKELSKSVPRRQRDPNFITRYFKGAGIDIGGYPDPLSLYLELFPLIESIKIWDLSDGDAQYMQGVMDEEFDFVVSSHCLEHLYDPFQGIKSWFRIIKPGGHLIVTIPEEDLYEQGEWPPKKNLDHKWTFTVWKESSWSPLSINVVDLVKELGVSADIRLIRVEDSGFRYQMPKFDQTLTPVAESAIEFVIRKKTPPEVESGTSRSVEESERHPDLRRYLNQYKDDMRNMKSTNSGKGPFQNQDPLT
jgi:SAM-dependent methyltransferase